MSFQPKFKLFYYTTNDGHIYHITCKMILENSVSEEEDDYNYEFFFQCLNTKYHITCKLLPSPLIVNILNKKIYGMDFDVNDLKFKYSLLLLRQKLNLDQGLKKILPWHLSQHPISGNELRLDSNENLNSFDENNIMVTRAYSTVNNNDMQNRDVLNKLELIYQTPNDENFYNVTCKDYQESENSNSYDDDYDYEFFFQCSNDSTTIFHVACKFLPHFLIVSILNKEIYGIDFDVNDLKRKYSLALHQKLNLEENLKQILPSYFSQNLMTDDEIMNSSNENIESDFTIDNQDSFDSGWSYNDYISHQDDETYP
ncbi:hypothetical protein C1645_755665 [Glomus cerebriforme]|uniref:Uncharacterized protein n=1 Tax=Glomus cerebriforme TaxID=658196 RepID=A0A397TD64_9GLOM|nr:hypothetical protein C1645_755665 [Glomus cerebriforme]